MSFSQVTPSLAQTVTTESYVSSVDFLSEIHKPDIGETLVKRYGDQSLTGFIDMMGGKKPVANQEFIHYEEDWIHQTFVVANDATQGASSDGTITGGYILDVSNADDGDSSTDERDYTFIRPNTVVEFENGEVGLVVGVSVNAGAWKVAEDYTTAESVSAANQCLILVLTYSGTNADVANVINGTGIITGTEF